MGHVIGIDTTYTGNPVSFNAVNGGTMKSVSVPLTYSQDLHGYDHPWPAGGGVNLVDPSKKVTTSATTGRWYNDGTGFLLHSGQTYTLSANVSTDATYFVYIYAIGGTQLSYGKWTATYTPSADVYVYLQYYESGGAHLANAELQLELGSTATSFAPYENICPISGRTGLNVYRTGKNLLNLVPLQSGTSQVRFGSISTNDYPYFLKAGTYTFSSEGEKYYTYAQRQGESTYTIIHTADRLYGTFTVSEDGWYRFWMYSGVADASKVTNAMVELGSTATTYEPYNGNTYAVDWTTQAGTVYGGTLDVVTGQLNVTHSIIDLGDVNWSKDSNRAGVFYGPITGRKISSYVLACSDYRVRNQSVSTVVDMYISGYPSYGGNAIFVRDTRFVSNTAAEYKVGSAGIKVVYELATPLTYQLTPKQIAAFIGQNYIWSSNNETLTAVLTAPATGFAGWLIKCVTNGTPVEIPLKYMRAETYTVTPDQRMEWSAERDVTGVLHRETVQNLPPKIEFNTPLMTNSDINALNSIIKAAFTNYLQRNITIQFYDPERDQYWEWDCYMPDVKYQIRNADIVNSIINYEELRYAFIGY